jgi:hypothetical protein
MNARRPALAGALHELPHQRQRGIRLQGQARTLFAVADYRPEAMPAK